MEGLPIERGAEIVDEPMARGEALWVADIGGKVREIDEEDSGDNAAGVHGKYGNRENAAGVHVPTHCRSTKRWRPIVSSLTLI